MKCKFYMEDTEIDPSMFGEVHDGPIEKTVLYECEAVVNDEMDNDLSVSAFEGMVSARYCSPLFVEFDYDSADGDFIEMMNAWVYFHDKLLSMKDKIQDETDFNEWLFNHETMKDFLVKFVGDGHVEKTVKLNNVIIMDKVNVNKLLIFIDSIDELK